MKRIITFFMLCCSFITNAQVTESPIVDNTKSSKAQIFAVGLRRDLTLVALYIPMTVYDLLNNETVRINPHTFIEYKDPLTGDLVTKEILQLQDENKNPLVLGKSYSGKSLLLLIFPSIPRGVNMINVIGQGRWKWYGIHITPRDDEDADVKRVASSEEEILQLIDNSSISVAGMYEQLGTEKNMPSNYQLALVQIEKEIYLLYVSSTTKAGTWQCGEIKAAMRPTVSETLYKADWYMLDKTIEPAVISFEGATMNLLLSGDEDPIVFVRMSGSQDDRIKSFAKEWTGTGFALNGGYILSNYHIIEGATSIGIYGVDGDYSKENIVYVVGVDRINDLALLKLEGSSKNEERIPYGFKSEVADVGDNIYVLGYPLTGTMGEEVKLTNGIISARTGFDGEVSQYQISAPVQPGNSGGPVFDYNGNVIGVISGKHSGAENVSYAIKTTLVRNLIGSVADISILPTSNALQGKSLKDQVKVVKDYVYIIKCRK